MSAKNKREKSGEEKNNGNMGHNKPPKPLATAAQCGEALATEASLTKNKNDATAMRYKLFLMATCSDAQLRSDMYAAWKNSVASAGQNAETRERVRTAKDTLFSMFSVPKLPTPEEKEQETKEQEGRRTLIQKNCLDTVHLCAYVHEMHYETFFRFNDKGGAYVTQGNALWDRIWEERKWIAIPKLVEADKVDVQIVTTTWDGEKGRAIAWSDLRTILIGGKREPGDKAGAADRQIVSDKNVSEAMQRVANFYETNAPKAEEMPAIRSSVENALRVIKNSLKAIEGLVKPELEMLTTFETALFARIKRDAPEVKVEGGSGKVTNIAEHNAKHDVKSPDTAKELPEGKPVRKAS